MRLPFILDKKHRISISGLDDIRKFEMDKVKNRQILYSVYTILFLTFQTCADLTHWRPFYSREEDMLY